MRTFIFDFFKHFVNTVIYSSTVLSAGLIFHKLRICIPIARAIKLDRRIDVQSERERKREGESTQQLLCLQSVNTALTRPWQRPNGWDSWDLFTDDWGFKVCLHELQNLIYVRLIWLVLPGFCLWLSHSIPLLLTNLERGLITRGYSAMLMHHGEQNF